MITLLIALAAGIFYLIAYHTYGRWLARKIFKIRLLDPAESRMTPDGAERGNGRPFLIGYRERQFRFH